MKRQVPGPFSVASRCLILGTVLGLGVGIRQQSHAEEPQGRRLNLATGYMVDPRWPQRLDGFVQEAVPGIAIDAQDRIYVYTRGKPPVQVYDAEGNFLRAWGEGAIESAHHIKIDQEGHVWTSDIGDHVVRKFTSEGKLLLTLGTPGSAGRDESHFNGPTDMAITGGGEVFVSDGYGNSRIVHFDGHGRYVNEWGQEGSGPGEFNIPHAIATDSRGRLYVADRSNARVQVFDQAGTLLDEWRNLLVPWGLCVTKTDEIWVCGSSPMQWRPEDNDLGCPPKDQVFMKFNTEGKLLQLWTVPKGADGSEMPGECNWVHSIAVDSQGNLYVGDIMGKRAQKFVMVPAES